jgi:hypothetical protein
LHYLNKKKGHKNKKLLFNKKSKIMCYIEAYFVTGLIIVMCLEYIFETFNDGEFKFSSYGERLTFFLFWPIIIYVIIKEINKRDDLF